MNKKLHPLFFEGVLYFIEPKPKAMRTKFNGFLLACLDKDFGKNGYIDYKEATKLDVDLYESVLKAHEKKFIFLNEEEVKEGDYVYISTKLFSCASKRGFGYVKKDIFSNKLYVDRCYLFGSENDYSFMKERAYIKHASEIILIFRK